MNVPFANCVNGIPEKFRITYATLSADNEELQAANEELQAANEELQSTNEELTTSKDEMQSLNEELQTANEELGTRSKELDELNTRYAETLERMPWPVMVIGEVIEGVSFGHGSCDSRFRPGARAVSQRI